MFRVLRNGNSVSVYQDEKLLLVSSQNDGYAANEISQVVKMLLYKLGYEYEQD